MRKRFMALFMSVTIGVLLIGLAGFNVNTAYANSLFSADKSSTTIVYPNPQIKANVPGERPTPQEDMFIYANYDFLKNKELKPGYSNYTALSEIAEQTQADTKKLLTKEYAEASDSQYVKMVYEMYSRYMDMDARNKSGWTTIIPYIEKIEQAKTVEDIFALAEENKIIRDRVLPVNLQVTIDSKNTPNMIACMYAPSLNLDDSAEYKKRTELGDIYYNAYHTLYNKLLLKYGYSEAEAAKMIENEYKWEEKLSEYIYPTEVSYRADYRELIYNCFTKDELIALMNGYPIERVLKMYNKADIEKVLIDQPEYFKALGTLYTDENIEMIKAEGILSLLSLASMYTDAESYNIYNEWVNSISGSTGMKPIDEQAYNFVSNNIDEVVGKVYADEYFSPQMKDDAEQIIKKLMGALRVRIQNEEWMEKATKDKAIEKLDNMAVAVGYPDKLNYDYSKLDLGNGDLLSMYLALKEFMDEEDLAMIGKPMDKSAWGIIMSANTINACYSPDLNMIMFPAAILQGKVYSKDASLAQKYGGLGTVAGHEMTHGFDTSGSQYDKDGNMKNWWTSKDKEAFTKLTEEVGKRYEQYALVDDMCVNGDLTIGETVADLGGMSLALDVLHQYEDAGVTVDYKEFFDTNAQVWAGITTREAAMNRLKTDPHAPNCLRVNVNISQFEEFVNAYGIKEGDAMYTAPENRLRVW